MKIPSGQRLAARLIAVQLIVLTAPILALITLRDSSMTQVRMTAIVVELTLLATVLLSVLVAWSILKPLAGLRDAVERVARGERRGAAPIGGNDEIGESIAAIDRLVGRLDDQMATVVTYAAESSHRLRTSLAAIKGSAEILREQGVADDVRARFASHIVTEVARMERSLRDTLTMARLESGNLPLDASEVDLAPRLRETAEVLLRDVELETSLPESLSVRLDAELIQDAVAALLENAAKFANGGKVKLSATKYPETLEITVDDSGPGIPDETAARIFDRFYTTGEAALDGSPATGLGLPIARAIARLHGGDLQCERSSLGGARFILTIPS